MHVLGIKQEIVERHPWVPINLFNAFDKAKAIAMQRMVNPRIVPLAWYREAWEEQEAILGPDPWEYGLTPRNRKTLETLVGYSFEQGLIRRNMPLEELFVDLSQGPQAGGVQDLAPPQPSPASGGGSRQFTARRPRSPAENCRRIRGRPRSR